MYVCSEKSFKILLLCLLMTVTIIKFSSNTPYITKAKNDDYVDSQRKSKPKVIVRETQLDRHQRLNSFCGKYMRNLSPEQAAMLEQNRNYYFKNYIYSDKVKTVYCYVPKAACTSWKRLFQMFEGNFKSFDDVGDKDQIHDKKYQQLANLTLHEQDLHVKSYYSFMFTRHPLDRLFATYRNKFLQPFNDTYYHDSYSYVILKAFRPTLSYSKYNETTITFLEFIKHVLTETGYIDQHWAPMHRVCQLCRYKFDYLGKHETLVEDAENILKGLDISHKYKFPKLKYDYKRKTTDLLKKYYEQIPKYIMKDLYEYYRIDFLAFGYDFEEYLQ